MNAHRLAALLCYPPVWLERGLLSEEFAALQLSEVEREYGSRVPQGGTEHFRYGAFLHWFKGELNSTTLGYLLEAAVADPDPPMVGNVLKEIASHPLCTSAMLRSAMACVSQSSDYYTAPEELERIFLQRAADDEP